MRIRVVATLVLVASIIYAAGAAYGFISAGNTASLLSLMSQGRDPSFDPARWTLRWRVACSVAFIFGVLGAAAGFAMYRRSVRAFAAWAVLVTALLVADLLPSILGVAVYAFERARIPDLVVEAFIAAASWLLYWRVRATPAAPEIAT